MIHAPVRHLVYAELHHPICTLQLANSRLIDVKASTFPDLLFSISSLAIKRRCHMNADANTAIGRTIRRHELREIVPLADSTIYEMEQRGEFPRRFALTPRCVVWDLAEVQAWLAARRSRPILRTPGPDVKQRRARPVKGQDLAPRSASTVG